MLSDILDWIKQVVLYVSVICFCFVLLVLWLLQRPPKGILVEHCVYAWWHEPHVWLHSDRKQRWCNGS